MKKYNIKSKPGPYGSYFTIEANAKERKDIERKAKRCGIKYRVYDKKWDRSSDYRSEFFKHNSEPFRCRYCNKKLKKNEVVVDHIIPVGKVKKNSFARTLLYIQGISTVNDYRNLAPACNKCNKKKSDQMGFWIIRGFLGKYRLYWILRKIVIFSLICFTIYLLWICQVHGILY